MIDINKLHPSILSDLRERGHTDKQISNMTVEKAFDEWCGWHLGDPKWGSTFRQVNKYIKRAEVPND